MNPIAEKIKKLLRMKRGGTPAEIETALRLAQELAQKYNIDISSINPDDDHAGATQFARFDTAARVTSESRYAAHIIKDYFHVDAVFRVAYNRLAIIGPAWRVEIATFVFKFVRRAFVQAWENRDKRRIRNRLVFMRAAYYGLSMMLRKTHVTPPETELQALEIYKRDCFPNTTKVSPRAVTTSTASACAGFMAGTEIHIRTAVKGATPRPSLAPVAPC